MMVYGEGNGEFRIMYAEEGEKWLNGHENEWKSTADGAEYVGGISRSKWRPGIRE